MPKEEFKIRANQVALTNGGAGSPNAYVKLKAGDVYEGLAYGFMPELDNILMTEIEEEDEKGNPIVKAGNYLFELYGKGIFVPGYFTKLVPAGNIMVYQFPYHVDN